MGKGYQGINPAPGRGGGKLRGARQSRAGHCACWVEQAECGLSCGGFAAASGLSRLCASLLEALGPPGLCESHWQGRDANSPGRYSDKPSEAAQAGKYWLLVGSTEEVLWLSLFYQVLRHCYIKGCFFPVKRLVSVGDQKVPSTRRVQGSPGRFKIKQVPICQWPLEKEFLLFKGVISLPFFTTNRSPKIGVYLQQFVQWLSH